jgi:hypothetical protein
MDPMGYLAGSSATRQSVYSALPDAPVIPERPRRWRGMSDAVRRRTATRLRRFADAVEPADVCVPGVC